MYRQSEKNLLNSSTSSTCPDNMVNFGLLTAEICWRVWGTPTNFNGFASWQRYCTASSTGRQPNIAALNRGRHLCSAGRPSGWALAHILVELLFLSLTVEALQGKMCQNSLPSGVGRSLGGKISQGEGVVHGEYFLVSTKLDTFCYPTVQTAPYYVPSFRHNTGV